MGTLKQRLKMTIIIFYIKDYFYVGIEKKLVFERPKNAHHLHHLCTTILNQGWGNISCQNFIFYSPVT